MAYPNLDVSADILPSYSEHTYEKEILTIPINNKVVAATQTANTESSVDDYNVDDAIKYLAESTLQTKLNFINSLQDNSPLPPRAIAEIFQTGNVSADTLTAYLANTYEKGILTIPIPINNNDYLIDFTTQANEFYNASDLAGTLKICADPQYCSTDFVTQTNNVELLANDSSNLKSVIFPNSLESLDFPVL